jgi:hypothetical protein
MVRAWRTAGAVDKQQVHDPENGQVPDQLLRRQKRNAKVEGRPHAEHDQARESATDEQRADGRLGHADQQHEQVIGKPLPADDGVQEVERRVVGDEGAAVLPAARSAYSLINAVRDGAWSREAPLGRACERATSCARWSCMA